MGQEKMYDVLDWDAVKPLLEVKWVALLIGWAFQGLLYMDRTERAFKLAIDAGLTIMLAVLLQRFVASYWAVGLGLVVAHTLNFIFNSHPYVVLKHFGATRYDQEAVLRYALAIGERIKGERSVLCAGIWGGFARGEHADPDTPDLDMRIVRRPGVLNGVRACWVALWERTQANLRWFPLDLYVFDTMERLSDLREDEIPIALDDPDHALETIYGDALPSLQHMLAGMLRAPLDPNAPD